MGRVLPLVFVILATGLHAEEPALAPQDAREVIVEGNRTWARARVARDAAVFERFLAPDFYAQLPDRRLTRQQFLERIQGAEAGVGLVRFDPTVLTVEGAGDDWSALILEKLEYEDAPGGAKRYALFVTRDGWKRANGQWSIVSTVVVGVERWRDGRKPPFGDW